MRTACMETVHASVSVATTRCCSRRVSKWTSLKRFPVIPPDVTRGGRQGRYSEIQYIMGNGHMGTLTEQNDRQTPVKTLPSRKFFVGW